MRLAKTDIKTHLMGGVAALALLATPGLAQTGAAQTDAPIATEQLGQAAQMQISDATGTPVTATDGSEIGQIEGAGLSGGTLVLILRDSQGRTVPLSMTDVRFEDDRFVTELSRDDVARMQPARDGTIRRVAEDATFQQAMAEVERRRGATGDNVERQTMRTAGGQFVVEQADPTVNVEVPTPQVSVNQRAPEVTVEQPEPTVTVQQAKPTVNVQQRAPIITVEQAQPTVSVDIPEPVVTITMPDPEVDVATGKPRVQVEQPDPVVRFVRPEPKVVVREAEPQINVAQADPQVDVTTAEQADANVDVSQGQPNVNVRSSGEADVNVSQAEPQVNVESAGQADVNVDQEQARVNLREGDTGQQTESRATDRTDTGVTATAQAGASATDTATRDNVERASVMPAQDGFQILDSSQLTAEDLTGTVVYGSNNEQVGELGDILLDESGKIQQVVLDIGGFLGIGERNVALDLSEVSIQQAQNGSELRVYVPHTENELEQMPEYR